MTQLETVQSLVMPSSKTHYLSWFNDPTRDCAKPGYALKQNPLFAEQ